MSSQTAPSNSSSTSSPGNPARLPPSLPRRTPPLPPRMNPEKSYTGPDMSTLDAPRSRSQAEKYFARVANENVLPSRLSKVLGVAGWLGGGVACVYMTLFADFGEREHVFSPVRRQYDSLKRSLFTLSPSERAIVGLDSARVGESESPR